ncbi:MAG: hypothetical protein II386_07190, partial [Bacteroidaceae bacterium]|nr:hypothetical protein [Bacteroidaceae bacterium]
PIKSIQKSIRHNFLNLPYKDDLEKRKTKQNEEKIKQKKTLDVRFRLRRTPSDGMTNIREDENERPFLEYNPNSISP